jgi:hypothetical protein
MYGRWGMLAYEIGMMSLLPILERVDCPTEREVTLRMENLDLGGVHFLSGVVRLRTVAHDGER